MKYVYHYRARFEYRNNAVVEGDGILISHVPIDSDERLESIRDQIGTYFGKTSACGLGDALVRRIKSLTPLHTKKEPSWLKKLLKQFRLKPA